MTPKAILQVSKALAVLFVFIGGLGCLTCVPFALSSSVTIVTMVGIFFVAGGVLMTGGLISFSILNAQK